MEVCVILINLGLHVVVLTYVAYFMHLRINFSVSHEYKYLKVIVTNFQHQMLW